MKKQKLLEKKRHRREEIEEMEPLQPFPPAQPLPFKLSGAPSPFASLAPTEEEEAEKKKEEKEKVAESGLVQRLSSAPSSLLQQAPVAVSLSLFCSQCDLQQRIQYHSAHCSV